MHVLGSRISGIIVEDFAEDFAEDLMDQGLTEADPDLEIAESFRRILVFGATNQVFFCLYDNGSIQTAYIFITV